MTAPQTGGALHAQAAATAAALYAASKTPPDPVAGSARIITNAAAVISASAAATGRMITNLWRTTDPYNEAQARVFAATAGQLIVAAQNSVAATTSAAQVMQLRSMGINPDIAVTIPENVRGANVKFTPDEVVVKHNPRTTVEYQPPAETAQASVEPQRRDVHAADSAPDRLFQRAAATYRFERSAGAAPGTANDAAEQRIGKLIDANLILAQRLAEQEALRQAQAQDSRILGYRRVIHPELSQGGVCGLCVAASDRIYKIDVLKPVHNLCKCAIVAVTNAHDPGHRLNRDDLARLYDEAGNSTNSAALKRTSYDIVHHAELGPILVRMKGEKVPYYSIIAPAQAA